MNLCLTQAEQRVLDCFQEGVWYNPESTTGFPFPWIDRPAYFCERLYQKGYLDRKVEFTEPGNLLSGYFVYQRLTPSID